ncbi:MAG: NAD(P)/FAD-dependent oxidoreductase, partial [Candidatus Woesearchaeota archaeon]|nr:NAD(P)/FAD-dependent oxidoreductase [Candidatus Woesearchaeota archaeon]
MRVAIIGGGFCGLHCAKKLESKHTVTLFDTKDYFEYTPSIHKLLTNADYAQKIQRPWAELLKKTTVITEPVQSLTNSRATSQNHNVVFDYAIVCTGISYPIFLKDTTDVYTVTNGHQIQQLAPVLAQAKKVLVIGGGLIGVEVAAEIAESTQAKLTIVHPRDKLMERNPSKAGNYAKDFLEKHHARIIFGEKVVDREKNTFITDKGTKIESDLTFWCAGIKADVPFFSGDKDKKGYIVVNEFLQSSLPNVFVGGDIAGVQEEKTAQNA